jgi:hypothetical protein
MEGRVDKPLPPFLDTHKYAELSFGFPALAETAPRRDTLHVGYLSARSSRLLLLPHPLSLSLCLD